MKTMPGAWCCRIGYRLEALRQNLDVQSALRQAQVTVTEVMSSPWDLEAFTLAASAARFDSLALAVYYGRSPTKWNWMMTTS